MQINPNSLKTSTQYNIVVVVETASSKKILTDLSDEDFLPEKNYNPWENNLLQIFFQHVWHFFALILF